MDQVKVALAVMKKHGFWILVVVVVLVGVGVWFTAARALAAAYEARKTALQTQYTTVNGIKSESTGEEAAHPNEERIERWSQRILKNRKEALVAWERMYADQKNRNQWPGSLSRRFHQMIREVEARGIEIPNEFLEEYQTFINQHFKVIDQMINRRKPKEVDRSKVAGGPMGAGYSTGGAEYMGAPGGMEYGGEEAGGDMMGYGVTSGVEMEGIVDWNDADYGRIQQGVYWVTRPLTIEVLLAQEDLWVYEALLRSIKKTNDKAGATNYYNAAIKRIEALEIGQPAAVSMKAAKSRIGMGGPGGGGGGYGGESMGSEYGGEMMEYGAEMEADAAAGSASMGMDMGMGGMGPGMGTGATRSPEQVKERLLRGRYVDMTGEPQASDAQPFAEFKLMPVHIYVIMDQQKLPDFLVSLANSEMPVDVKQVSIQAGGKMNPVSGGGYGMGGMPGGDMTGDYGGMGGFGAMGSYGGVDTGAEGGGDYGGGGYGGAMGGYSSRGAATSTHEVRQDVPIEIFGVIRIFNPPDMEKLGTGSATDESPEGSTAALPPADAPTMVQPKPAPEAGPGPAPEAPGPAPAAPGPVPATPGPAPATPGPAPATPGPAPAAPGPAANT
ncbi:MAG: hypothetical protein GXX96_39910 [Planctomycetaceae bacterium]|nr:hypothetical protein [Planctomycetaceae bacterium]